MSLQPLIQPLISKGFYVRIGTVSQGCYKEMGCYDFSSGVVYYTVQGIPHPINKQLFARFTVRKRQIAPT